MGKLNWSKEFDQISDEEWRNKVVADLKGKNFDETLVWEDNNGLKHQPYYRKSDINSLKNLAAQQDAQKKNLDWEILPMKEKNMDLVSTMIHSKMYNAEAWSKLAIDRCHSLDLGIYKRLGANIVHELAFALHHVLEYVDALTNKGLSPKLAFEKLNYRLEFGTSYFSEIAKGRAFRFLLNKLFSVYKAEGKVELIGEGSDYFLAHKDVHTNLLRTTTMAMSAILAGCNKVYVPTFDSLGEESALGKRMATNIQQILKEESSFNKTIDPAAGSYYVEQLTSDLSQKAWNKFLEIEEKGGLFALLKEGELAIILEQDKEERIRAYKLNEQTLIGVNKYQNEKGVNVNTSSEVLAKQIEE